MNLVSECAEGSTSYDHLIHVTALFAIEKVNYKNIFFVYFPLHCNKLVELS